MATRMLAHDELRPPSDLQRRWADRFEPTVSRWMGWLITHAWRATSQDAHALISRLSAHLVVIGLAVLAVALSGVRVPGRARSSALPPPTPPSAASWGNRTAYEVLTARGGPRFTGDDSQIVRLAVPLSPNINRPRKDVISYTVQPGDSLFGIISVNLKASGR